MTTITDNYKNPFYKILSGSKQVGIDKTMHLKVLPENCPEFSFFSDLLNFDLCIAGGFYKDLFNGKEAKDLDLYFPSREKLEEFEKVLRAIRSYTVVYDTPNSIGFKHTSGVLLDCVKKYGTPAQILDTFDFTICKFALFKVAGDDTTSLCVAYSVEGLMDLIYKNLSYSKNQFNTITPTINGALNRVLRYTQYGYNLTHDSKKRLSEYIAAQYNKELEYSVKLETQMFNDFTDNTKHTPSAPELFDEEKYKKAVILQELAKEENAKYAAIASNIFDELFVTGLNNIEF